MYWCCSYKPISCRNNHAFITTNVTEAGCVTQARQTMPIKSTQQGVSFYLWLLSTREMTQNATSTETRQTSKSQRCSNRNRSFNTANAKTSHNTRSWASPIHLQSSQFPTKITHVSFVSPVTSHRKTVAPYLTIWYKSLSSSLSNIQSRFQAPYFTSY
jgi:hypothetical protein